MCILWVKFWLLRVLAVDTGSLFSCTTTDCPLGARPVPQKLHRASEEESARGTMRADPQKNQEGKTRIITTELPGASRTPQKPKETPRTHQKSSEPNRTPRTHQNSQEQDYPLDWQLRSTAVTVSITPPPRSCDQSSEPTRKDLLGQKSEDTVGRFLHLWTKPALTGEAMARQGVHTL